MNSRNKGKRGELAAVKEWKAAGYDAHRTQQFCGKGGDSDLVVKDLPWLHVEVKNAERLNIDDALAQAERDRRLWTIPLVMHKKNFTGWKVTMSFEDWLKILHGDLPVSPGMAPEEGKENAVKSTG